MSTITAVQPASPNQSMETAVQFGIGKIILLHLLPGAVVMAVFALLGLALKNSGLPNMIVFVLAALFALTGGQLGFLYYQGWKRNRRFSLEGIVLFREPMKTRTYFWLVPAVLFGTMALFIGLSFIDNLLYTGLFSWWPSAWDLSLDPTNQPQAVTVITVILMYAVVNTTGPIVEELYFRGYLLPRMESFGRLAPVINAVLFAAYHFWSPWAIVSRAIAILPLTFTVFRRRNIMVGILVHCALNCIGSIPMVLAAL